MTHKLKNAPKVRHLQHVKPAASNARFLAAIGAGLLIFLVANILRGQSTVPADFVSQVKGTPRIAVISDQVIDHGDLIVNRTVASSFEIQNVGDQTLVVLSPWVVVHEGCCPPQATISNQKLHPGEIATVSMQYMMHPGMDGPHDLRIHVRSNDPENPEIQLTALSNWVSV